MEGKKQKKRKRTEWQSRERGGGRNRYGHLESVSKNQAQESKSEYKAEFLRRT